MVLLSFSHSWLMSFSLIAPIFLMFVGNVIFVCLIKLFICTRFLWMVRIGGGVFPVIKEPDYLVNGEYRVDKGAAPKMLNCLM
jgi:hypothetical protein